MSDVTKFVDDFKIAIIERNQKTKMLEAEIERLRGVYDDAVKKYAESLIEATSLQAENATLRNKLVRVREWEIKKRTTSLCDLPALRKILDGE